jgi:transcriptional regulator with GAF, ATPase, and Fis domain
MKGAAAGVDDYALRSTNPGHVFASDLLDTSPVWRPSGETVARESADSSGTHEPDQEVDRDVLMPREMAAFQSCRGIVYNSEAVRGVLDQVHLVASTNTTVLLLGETGVGKEMFAQAIHEASPRRDRRMVRVNCAAIPATLIESALFGHERGAFTDAVSRQIGRFEAAHGSTLFLDEIGELPLELQAKLLRVLQERTLERLGGHQAIKVDVRIIAATNRDLEQAVKGNAFREDLFYRLNVFPITIPPLRERVSDIPGLVWTFIDELSPRLGKAIEAISSRSLFALERYPWPGNIRELRNVIERELILARGPVLSPAAPRARRPPVHSGSERLIDIQTEHIRRVLDTCGWRIRGMRGAAERLGMKPTTLESQMARLGILRHKEEPRMRIAASNTTSA